MLTPTVVRNTRFTMTRLRPGYQPKAVDDFLDQIGAGLERLIRENDEIRVTGLEALAPPIPPPYRTARNPGLVTPVDVRNAQFVLTWPGYEPMEVDDFLDRIEDRLDRLVRENDAIRAQFGGTR